MMGEERNTAAVQDVPFSDTERKLKASEILYNQNSNAVEVLLAA